MKRSQLALTGRTIVVLLAGLLTCIGVTACGYVPCGHEQPGFYVEGQLLGADGCPLKNASVQVDWDTVRDAERDQVPRPREASTDENGRFDVYLSTWWLVATAICRSPVTIDYYEPTDLEMIELTIDAADSVETIEVQIAEEMIIGSNSVSEIDIDLGVITLQEISTCGEDATGDES